LVEDKEYFLQKLEERHYYVNLLLQNAIDQKYKEIERVTGSTIDALVCIPKKNDFTRLAHGRALKKYFDRVDRNQWLTLMVRNGFENFHAAVLYGDDYFYVEEIHMSSDSKYLRAIGRCGNTIIWDMEHGTRVELSRRDIRNTHWNAYGSEVRDRRYVSDQPRYKHSYTATVVKKEDIDNAEYMGIDLNKKWQDQAIILYKVAEEKAWIIQEALGNSNTKEELRALLSSKVLSNIIGYPRENFKKAIQAKINKL
jgi:hypothetical protein